MTTTRRDFMKGAMLVGLGATLGAPALVRRAIAAEPIKIGVPATLSGSNAQYGLQAKRACELFAKDMKGKLVVGRPIEFIFEDTGGDPATAVRKSQKLVEKDGVKFLTGIALSSEALAVSAKCPEWGVIFMSTINGAGALTAKSYNRNFFRPNTSGPMGTRAVALYLQDSPMKRFFGMGADYAWGRDSVGAFEKLVKGMSGKEMAGSDFPPVGTKDYASYIAKIKQAKPDGCFLVLPGQDASVFFKQAVQFGLTKDVKMIMEILELESMKAVGDSMAGAIGGSRYPFTLDNAKNRDFVKRFHDLHGLYPDMFDGETYEGLEWLTQVIQKAGTADDIDKVIAAWEDSSYEGLEGPFVMRKCDHQATQPGFVVEAVKDAKYPHLIPKIIATYPPDKVTPKCRTEEFS